MNWKIAYAHHKDCTKKEYNTIESLEKSGFDVIPASVPGNFEVDLMKAGRLEDLYFSQIPYMHRSWRMFMFGIIRYWI